MKFVKLSEGDRYIIIIVIIELDLFMIVRVTTFDLHNSSVCKIIHLNVIVLIFQFHHNFH